MREQQFTDFVLRARHSLSEEMTINNILICLFSSVFFSAILYHVEASVEKYKITVVWSLIVVLVCLWQDLDVVCSAMYRLNLDQNLSGFPQRDLLMLHKF